MKRTFLLLLVLAAAACSSSPPPSKPAAPPPQAPPPAAAAGPTRLSRVDPDIIEETETSYVKRLPKEQYLKVDDRHVRHPLIAQPVEFFKEDDKYYYMSVSKTLPEESEALRLQQQQSKAQRPADSTPPPSSAVSAVPLADFEDLDPPREAARFRLEPVPATGLPEGGMWRASFRLADVNGDRIPDIVSPPARMGDGDLEIWIGDGTGRFTPWKLSLSEDGKPLTRFSIDYGGVAVGDIDADGNADVVSASHGGGLVSLFGDGKGGFAVVRKGLPSRDFSAQAVTLADADRDGKLDLVASRDIVDPEPNQVVDKMQVRVYAFLGREKGWEHRKDGIVGGFYSNSLNTFDYDQDGLQDILTGSHYTGALTLIWKNQGGGTFSGVMFPAIEVYSYHFATAPGTFGKARVPAFADSILMQTNVPVSARAAGITLYAFQNGEWSRNRIWRKKDPKSSVFGLAMGDLDGDGLDEVVFADSDRRRIRILTQRADGSFAEIAEEEEPALDSPGQCIRLADVNADGRIDVVVSKTITSANPNEKGGWSVYLNRVK